MSVLRIDATGMEAFEALCKDSIERTAELEKRIGEMEAVQFTPTGDSHHNALKCPYCNPGRIDPAAERQRRINAEAALRLFVGSNFDKATGDNAAAYFSRYPSESDNRTKVAGSH